MNDDVEAARLRERLRAADPAAAQPAGDPSWIDDLAEATMSTQSPRSARPRLMAAAAAVTAVVLGVGIGTAALLDRGEGPGGVASGTPTEPTGGGTGSPEPTPSEPSEPTETRLQLGEEDAMAACLRPSADILVHAPVAFEGTAVEVVEGEVLLEVDQWFKGGDADRVRLAAPDPRFVPLIGGFAFEEGEAYLVAANRGTVNLCGFSGPKTPELAAMYAEAFGS